MGLPLRDDLWGGAPAIPAMMPMFLVVFAAVAAGLLQLAKERAWQRRSMTVIGLILGALAGFLAQRIALMLRAPGNTIDPAGAIA
ncbi:Uncharacterised protein [Mycobacteroides abscessus subsp. abscessus]|nr:Uncharacterised protein [Mycobacteroides abscessus subsp. abscessus]